MPPPHEWGKGAPPVVTLARLRSEKDLGEFVVGCDADIGGGSNVNLSLDEDGFGAAAASCAAAYATGRFHGALSTQVTSGMRVGNRKVVRSGYAGMRTVVRAVLSSCLTVQDRRTVLGAPRVWDTSYHNFLHIRLRNMIQTPSRFYVNLQTAGSDPQSLYQHRLWLHNDVGTDWQSILVPFSDFTLTAKGNVVENQIGMFRSKVRTVGISVLGPGEGPFDLRIAAFRLCSA